MSGSGTTTVLYADSDESVRRAVTNRLESADGEPSLSVRTAAGEAGALETLGVERIDCVVSAARLTDGNGLHLLEAIRARQSAVPFVLFAGDGSDTTARDAFRAGVTDYMGRDDDPETLDVLVERVRAAVRDATDDPRDRAEYRAGTRRVALDAATSLMSAKPDELDAKIRFSLRSLCERMGIDRAATYRAFGPDPDHGYDRRHVVGELPTDSTDTGGHDDTDAGTQGDTDAGTQRDTDAGERVTDMEVDGGVDAKPTDTEPTETLPRELTPETHGEWLDRLATFETVTYGPTAAHPSVETPAGPTNRSGVAAPMIAGWQLDGVVVFDAPPDRTWSREEVRLLETVTELTARAMERRQQTRELREQNERLEQFASVVSHDLRNPLNVADGWLDLAEEGNEEAFDRVQRSLDRMEKMIEDVLTLARDGADVGETEPVAVERVAREAWTRVETHDAELSVESVGEIDADEHRLASIFENLFRNSIEHGRNDVVVSVGPTTDGFFVADNGPGLPDGADVFEWGETTADDGSGLGLAIVARIADGHGWDVTSVPDADGARFEFVV